jgi:dienelactone hydrolase
MTQTSARRSRRPWIIALGAVVAILALAVLGFVVWANATPAPMPEALAALESDAQVQVTVGDWLVFAPTGATPAAGFIFYPGGRVDPISYAPAMRALAQAGYLVVVPSMPLNLAVLAPNRATEIMAAYPAVGRWGIGGHSLGGAMAASYMHNHPGAAAALVLWAAFPPDGGSLAGRDELSVASIYGTLDGLATPADIQASVPLLPAGTAFVPIEGGNHAQFGWYGDQAGDNPATISREEQQRQAVTATLATLPPP